MMPSALVDTNHGHFNIVHGIFDNEFFAMSFLDFTDDADDDTFPISE
jgi:hypothetical protein